MFSALGSESSCGLGQAWVCVLVGGGGGKGGLCCGLLRSFSFMMATEANFSFSFPLLSSPFLSFALLFSTQESMQGK